MVKNSVPLPREIIPFILENLEGFDVQLEEGERIVITPKADAEVRPSSRTHLLSALEHTSEAAGGYKAPPRVVVRPKFIYHAKDRRKSPEEARAFGLSKPRLLVYTIVYNGGEEGVGYQAVRTKSKLPHGSVMQILHWLRKQGLITGAPEVLSK